MVITRAWEKLGNWQQSAMLSSSCRFKIKQYGDLHLDYGIILGYNLENEDRMPPHYEKHLFIRRLTCGINTARRKGFEIQLRAATGAQARRP